MRLDERGIIVKCSQCGQLNRLLYEKLSAQEQCGKCKTPLPLPEQPLEITQAEHFKALTEKTAIPVFVDFWAPWCGPCKMVAPEIEKVAAQAEGKFMVIKMNTDEVPEISQSLQISSIPTMAVYFQGRELARTAGARPAPAILSFIRSAIPA